MNMKEKIAAIRDKADVVRKKTDDLSRDYWNGSLSAGHTKAALIAMSEGLDRLTDILEDLYSEEHE